MNIGRILLIRIVKLISSTYQSRHNQHLFLNYGGLVDLLDVYDKYINNYKSMIIKQPLNVKFL